MSILMIPNKKIIYLEQNNTQSRGLKLLIKTIRGVGQKYNID